MGYRKNPLTTGEYFHIYNRGVEKRQIAVDDHDRTRWIQTMLYYRFADTKSQFSLADIESFSGQKPLVDVISYCLIPNHFHLLAKQVLDNGITEWLRKTTVSYCRYFNTRHNRVGSLFQGPYKSRRIATTEDLLHVSRYIHLNPFVARIAEDPTTYRWSSFPAYLQPDKNPDLAQRIILDQFTSPEEYIKFVTDFADYARSLHDLQYLFIDI